MVKRPGAVSAIGLRIAFDVPAGVSTAIRSDSPSSAAGQRNVSRSADAYSKDVYKRQAIGAFGRHTADCGRNCQSQGRRATGDLAIAHRRLHEAEAGTVHHQDGTGCSRIGKGVQAVVLIEGRAWPGAAAGLRENGGGGRGYRKRSFGNRLVPAADPEVDWAVQIESEGNDRVYLFGSCVKQRGGDTIEQNRLRSRRKRTQYRDDFPGSNGARQQAGPIQHAFGGKSESLSSSVLSSPDLNLNARGDGLERYGVTGWAGAEDVRQAHPRDARNRAVADGDEELE